MVLRIASQLYKKSGDSTIRAGVIICLPNIVSPLPIQALSQADQPIDIPDEIQSVSSPEYMTGRSLQVPDSSPNRS